MEKRVATKCQQTEDISDGLGDTTGLDFRIICSNFLSSFSMRGSDSQVEVRLVVDGAGLESAFPGYWRSACPLSMMREGMDEDNYGSELKNAAALLVELPGGRAGAWTTRAEVPDQDHYGGSMNC